LSPWVSSGKGGGSTFAGDTWHGACPTKTLVEEVRTLREPRMFDPLDSAKFGEYVLKSKGMVLVNFWTPWSQECRNMSSLMGDVQDLLVEQDRIVRVDWDQQRQLAKEFEVLGVPTLLIFVRGHEVARYYGTMNEEDLRKCVIEAKRSENSKNVRP
jgi:thioredoxin 1